MSGRLRVVTSAFNGVLAPVLAMMHGFSMTLHSQVISGRDNVIGMEFMYRFFVADWFVATAEKDAIFNSVLCDLGLYPAGRMF